MGQNHAVNLDEVQRIMEQRAGLYEAVRVRVDSSIRASSTKELLTLTVSGTDATTRILSPEADREYLTSLYAYLRGRLPSGVVRVRAGAEQVVEDAVMAAVTEFYTSGSTVEKLTRALVEQSGYSRKLQGLVARTVKDESAGPVAVQQGALAVGAYLKSTAVNATIVSAVNAAAASLAWQQMMIGVTKKAGIGAAVKMTMTKALIGGGSLLAAHPYAVATGIAIPILAGVLAHSYYGLPKKLAKATSPEVAERVASDEDLRSYMTRVLVGSIQAQV